MNWAPAHIAPRELREVYLHPFEAGGPRRPALRSVMNAYNELDGVPCAADRGLLTDAPARASGASRAASSPTISPSASSPTTTGSRSTPRRPRRWRSSAGLDVELPGTDCYGAPLCAALEAALVDRGDARHGGRARAAGEVRARAVRAAVRRARAGRRRDTRRPPRAGPEIARKSLVLLRNDGTLPLAPRRRSVAVIGPNADEARNLLGDYAYPAHVESLLEMCSTAAATCSRCRSPSTSARRRRRRRRRRCSTRCASGSARAVRVRPPAAT